MTSNIYSWESEVRPCELDGQQIVNNAVYFQYFDHVRTKQMLELGIDWMEWHNLNYNFVLVHTDIHFKAPLK